MRLNDDLYVLALPIRPDILPGHLHLSVLLDAAHGPTLVDTGMPKHRAELTACLAEADIAVAALKRIILTHQDLDHVGLLHELAAASGAEILAHRIEVPAIDGSGQARFMAPEVQALLPAIRSMAEGFQATAVDRALEDGARLDLAGGVRVIHTPGHTPGHISLYLERSKTLIAGDALALQEGRLTGPNPRMTPDPAQARQSIRKLADLEVAAIVCYHGGVLRDDAQAQLRRLAEADPASFA